MPIIDIEVPQGALQDNVKHELMNQLGNVAIGYEGLSGSQFAKEFTWLYIHELPSAFIAQVSGVLPKPIYRVTFTTLETLMDDETKHKLGADVAKAIYRAEGSKWDEEEAYNRVWTFYNDVRQGDWIAGARINNIPDLKAKVDEERAAA